MKNKLVFLVFLHFSLMIACCGKAYKHYIEFTGIEEIQFTQLAKEHRGFISRLEWKHSAPSELLNFSSSVNYKSAQATSCPDDEYYLTKGITELQLFSSSPYDSLEPGKDISDLFNYALYMTNTTKSEYHYAGSNKERLLNSLQKDQLLDYGWHEFTYDFELHFTPMPHVQFPEEEYHELTLKLIHENGDTSSFTIDSVYYQPESYFDNY